MSAFVRDTEYAVYDVHQQVIEYHVHVFDDLHIVYGDVKGCVRRLLEFSAVVTADAERFDMPFFRVLDRI